VLDNECSYRKEANIVSIEDDKETLRYKQEETELTSLEKKERKNMARGASSAVYTAKVTKL